MAVVIVVFVGGIFGYQYYQSMTYDNLLNKSESSFIESKHSFNQLEKVTSVEEGIGRIKQSINYADQAINETAQMINVAPDNATREYAVIRNDQFKIMKQMDESYLHMLEAKMNGTGGTVASKPSKAKSIDTKLSDDQDRLVMLVKSNFGLKQRLTHVLGEEIVKQILGITDLG